MNKNKMLNLIEHTRQALKLRVNENRSKREREEICVRGEQESDFFSIWYKLCKLERMEKWVIKYGYLTRSQKKILKEYSNDQ